jgi:hypothetical protein
MTNGWPVGPMDNTEVGHTSQGVALGWVNTGPSALLHLEQL